MILFAEDHLCARCQGEGRIIRWGDGAKQHVELCPVCRGSGQATKPFHNPISNKKDPETSHDAADQHEKSGKRQTNAAVVLQTVRQRPGLTSIELASWITGLTLTEVRRRLTDLLHRGDVRQGDRRGRELTWWPMPSKETP